MVVLVQKGNMKRPFELLYILSVFPWFCVIYSEPFLPVLNPEPAQVAGQVIAKQSLIKLSSIQQGDTPFKRIPRASKLNADLSGAVRRQEGADVSIVGMTPHAQTVGKHDAKTTFEVYRLLDVGQCTDAIPWREDRMAGDRQTNNLKTSFGQLRRFMEVRCRCNNALVSPPCRNRDSSETRLVSTDESMSISATWTATGGRKRLQNTLMAGLNQIRCEK